MAADTFDFNREQIRFNPENQDWFQVDDTNEINNHRMQLICRECYGYDIIISIVQNTYVLTRVHPLRKTSVELPSPVAGLWQMVGAVEAGDSLFSQEMRSYNL